MQAIVGLVTPTAAIVLLVIALLIFGPGKLPELGKSLGKGIKEFKSATNEEEEKAKREKEEGKKND